jgi:hypothetical protein
MNMVYQKFPDHNSGSVRQHISRYIADIDVHPGLFYFMVPIGCEICALVDLAKSRSILSACPSITPALTEPFGNLNGARRYPPALAAEREHRTIPKR